MVQAERLGAPASSPSTVCTRTSSPRGWSP